MRERFVFLTGHLARDRLRRTLEGIGESGFAWEVVDIGVQVAALMTEPIIERRLSRPLEATRVFLPGRAGVDPARLTGSFGVPFIRGPDEIVDLPEFLGRGAAPPDLSRHDIRIFAEIVDAPSLPVDALLRRARALAADGADVIDLGCRPGATFRHLEDAIAALHAEGLRVSVDSGDAAELRRGALAGADFLLSLNETNLQVTDGTRATPVLVPVPEGGMESLLRAAAAAQTRRLACLLDPILEPIHFGFAASLQRYAALRAELPEAEILMGTGNLTELTDADSSGVTALLLGICSELGIRNILAVQVSPHTRRTIAEHDFARRLMYAARADGDLPRGYGNALLQVHDRSPFPAAPADIAAQAASVRDVNYRIAVAEDGIHVYNARQHEIGTTAMALFPALSVDADAPHAFYLGTELMKAEIAFTLGKRYVQDEALEFGCATPTASRERTRLAEAGATLQAKRGKRADDP